MPKFLGMEAKTWLWVGGALAAVLVVYYAIKARNGDAGGMPVGAPSGGDWGPMGPSSPANQQPIPDSSGDEYARQLRELDLETQRNALSEQKAMFDLYQRQQNSALDFWQVGQNLSLDRQRAEQSLQLGLEQEQFRTAQAAQEVVTRSVKGKKKVECPKGMHLVVLPDGSAACQEKGGGGFNIKTIFSGIGDIAEGLFSGAAAAAPGIGYGAAQYGAVQAGLAPRQLQPAQYGSGQQYYTPPIAPPGAPYARQPGMPQFGYTPQTNKGMVTL